MTSQFTRFRLALTGARDLAIETLGSSTMQGSTSVTVAGTCSIDEILRFRSDYRARYYNPAIGRFLSEDPLGFLAGPNFYAYAADDPIDLVDPSGMQEIMLMEGPPLIDPALMDNALRVANPKQSLEMPDGGRLDLTGKPHIDPDTGEPIPTPHVHYPNQPFDPPYDNPTDYPPGAPG